MYIRKQPSDGRGEYEISESGNGLSPHDLENCELVLTLGELGTRPTGIRVAHQGGKHRLRQNDLPGKIHFHRQIQAALLFPKSIRDESKLPGGQPTIMKNGYLVKYMHFGSVTKEGGLAMVSMASLDLFNGSQDDEVLVVERSRRVARVLGERAKLPEDIAVILARHAGFLQEGSRITLDCEKNVDLLMKAVADCASDYDVNYMPDTDVLVPLEEILALPELPRPLNVEQIPLENVEIRVREVAKWQRWAATRGAEGAKFRRQVREAYDSTCLVCGVRLPKGAHCAVPGVDAAHILPWAQIELDEVFNGMCLCKLHHWAFDQALIAIVHEDGKYTVRTTQRAILALGADSTALKELNRACGVVPATRLPSNVQKRPHPELLAKLYEAIAAG